MRASTKGPWLRLALAGWVICCAGGVWACDIPLYRFALDLWEPDKYEAVIFHRGGLTGEAAAAAEWLKRQARDGPVPANCYVRLVDLAAGADEDESVLKLWRAQGDPAPPWAVLCYPDDPTVNEARAVWAGPLTMPAAQAMMGSPVRAQIVRRIEAGQTIVWVLLESGDRAKDQAAAKLLEEQSKKLQSQMNQAMADTQPASAPAELPAPWPEPFTEPVAFSLLRLSRADPRETVLVNMLLDNWPGLREQAATAPAAFPVFGRGRVPGALVGSGIDAESVAEACWLITGPCSCGMASPGGGMDLLIHPGWQPPAAAGSAAGRGGHLLRNLLIAVCCVFAAAIVLSALLLRKGRGRIDPELR